MTEHTGSFVCVYMFQLPYLSDESIGRSVQRCDGAKVEVQKTALWVKAARCSILNAYCVLWCGCVLIAVIPNCGHSEISLNCGHVFTGNVEKQVSSNCGQVRHSQRRITMNTRNRILDYPILYNTVNNCNKISVSSTFLLWWETSHNLFFTNQKADWVRNAWGFRFTTAMPFSG